MNKFKRVFVATSPTPVFASVGYVFGVSSDKKHRVRARTSTPTVVFASVGYMFLVYIMTKNIDVLQERLYSFSEAVIGNLFMDIKIYHRFGIFIRESVIKKTHQKYN